MGGIVLFILYFLPFFFIGDINLLYKRLEKMNCVNMYVNTKVILMYFQSLGISKQMSNGLKP